MDSPTFRSHKIGGGDDDDTIQTKNGKHHQLLPSMNITGPLNREVSVGDTISTASPTLTASSGYFSPDASTSDAISLPLHSSSLHEKIGLDERTTKSAPTSNSSRRRSWDGKLKNAKQQQQSSQQSCVIPSDKLHFHSRRLIGRDREVATLRDCLNRMSQLDRVDEEEPADVGWGTMEVKKVSKASLNRMIRSLDNTGKRQQQQPQEYQKRRELVLISGDSGVGKSALAQELRKHVKAAKGIFCTGRYESTSTQETTLPFSGLSQACRQICDEILETQQSHQGFFFEIQDKIKTNIGMVNIDILSILMPQIYDVIGEREVNDKKKANNLPPALRRGSMDRRNSMDRMNLIDQSNRSASKFDHVQRGREKQQRRGSRDSSLDGLDTRRKNRLSNIQAMGDDTKQERLEAALKVFFKFVSQEFAPVVLVLDDLQWADAASLKMLQSLMMHNFLNTELMVIGCFQTGEVDDQHPLTQLIDAATHVSSSSNTFSFTRMKVEKFSMIEMTEFLSDLLMKEKDGVQRLAQLCLLRTGGNVLYTREYLSMLVGEGFLKYHNGTPLWDWNVAAIRDQTEAAPGIVEMIQNRIKRQDPELVKLLTIAACLGHTFTREVLQLLWEYHHDMERELWVQSHSLDESYSSTADFDKLLEQAVFETFVEPKVSADGRSNAIESCTAFQFTHDQVRDALLALIPSEELPRAQYTIGRLLLDNMAPSDVEAMFLTIVELINSAEHKEDITIANVNLQAASQAYQLGAFASAKAFAINGVSRLPEKKSWKVAPGLFDSAMDLHALAAQANAALGNFEEAEAFCRIILAEDEASPIQKSAAHKVALQKFKAYKEELADMQHQSAGDLDALKAALDMNIDMLSTLGVEVPRNKIVRKLRAKKYVEKTKKHLAEISDFHSMQALMDPIELEKINLLDKAGSLSFSASDTDLHIMMRCLFVDSHKTGLTELSGCALASFAIVLAHHCGDFEAAVDVAELSLSVQSVLPRYFEARNKMTAYFYVLGWVQPLRIIPRQIQLAYESAISAGNTESVSFAVLLFLWTKFMASERLDVLHQDFEHYLNEMSTFLPNDIRATLLKSIWQLCKNLTGHSENTALLCGDVFDEVGEMKEPNPLIAGTLPRMKAFACMFFADYETGADLVLKIGGSKFLQKFPGAGYGMEYLPFGICCYAAANRTKDKRKRRQYRKMAEQLRKETESYTEKGCVNLEHILSLLNAEHYASTGKAKKAEDHYKRAILEATRGRYRYSAAVANERHADFLLEQKNKDEALSCLNQAKKCYSDWGAKRVVTRLVNRRSALQLR